VNVRKHNFIDFMDESVGLPSFQRKNFSFSGLKYFGPEKALLTFQSFCQTLLSSPVANFWAFPIGSFSEQSDKIGRGFIKILETWQLGLSFNIIRHVFFCFGQN
jgi:hypothetical protein